MVRRDFFHNKTDSVWLVDWLDGYLVSKLYTSNLGDDSYEDVCYEAKFHLHIYIKSGKNTDHTYSTPKSKTNCLV